MLPGTAAIDATHGASAEDLLEQGRSVNVGCPRQSIMAGENPHVPRICLRKSGTICSCSRALTLTNNELMISLENLAAFLLFAIVATASPGPNNMMALAASARVGFVRSVPLVLGIAAGVCLLIISVGLGLGTVLESLPWLYDLLRVAGTAYLLYLAWQIAAAGVIDTSDRGQSPLTFLNGATFQIVNPKAWVIATSIVSTYVPAANYTANVILLAFIFGLTAIVAVSLWAGFGSTLRRSLSEPRTALWFNRIMGGALAVSVLPMAFL